MDVLQVALDYWTVPLAPERLPMVAAQLLAEGYDSLALREAAGMPVDDVVALREVFAEALRQLNVFVEDVRQAQVRQIQRWARDVLAGTLTRNDFVALIHGLWEFDEVAFDDGLPAAVRELALICHVDEGRTSGDEFSRALREVAGRESGSGLAAGARGGPLGRGRAGRAGCRGDGVTGWETA